MISPSSSCVVSARARFSAHTARILSSHKAIITPAPQRSEPTIELDYILIQYYRDGTIRVTGDTAYGCWWFQGMDRRILLTS